MDIPKKVPRLARRVPPVTYKQGELTVGLWPARVNEYLSVAKVILPPYSEPARRYIKEKYCPIIPHPYLAMFSQEEKCLDIPPGLAKTQKIVLDVWAGNGPNSPFEQKFWAKSLLPLRGHLEPAYVFGTGVFGRVLPADAKCLPKVEKMFKEAYGWLHHHRAANDFYGKFDYGNWRYMLPTPMYVTEASRWAKIGEMAREGYWHNNERDPARGVLLHYFRTGDRQAYELAADAMQHLYDVDISHTAWGMYTHTYGHCYRSQGTEPDHAWLEGMLQWACVSGDPLFRQWILRCGETLEQRGSDWCRKTDLRSISMQLYLMSVFYRYTGEQKYKELAAKVADILKDMQLSDGGWPTYFNRPPSVDPKQHIWLVEHAGTALTDYSSMKLG